jgi:alkanesulfonate monooxygenase SsuD/methylene tetrahydromethanopterin reductase-like flavin-dependent oxidoreductase (luciferase family)
MSIASDLSFGIFDHLDRGSRPLDEYYEDRLKIAEAADAAGFYSYHVAEHHATPLGMAPSPGIFFGAVAQRTKRLRFGPMVYLLPLYHPIRLTEEIAMLDQLSHGRYDPGIGRGISPIESSLYGRDPSHAQQLFDEVHAIVTMGLEKGRVDFDGEHYHFHDVPIEIGPYQRPHPPFWYGITSVESAERCVARGFNGMALSRTDTANEISHRYTAAAKAAGKTQLKMGVGRFVVLADTDAEALAVARRAYPIWHENFHHLYHVYGRSPVHGERPIEYEAMMELGLAYGGSPATVIAALRKDLEASGAGYAVSQFMFGDMTLDEGQRSLTLFRDKVMPALRGAAVNA